MRLALIHLHPDFSAELDSVCQKWSASQHVVSFHGFRPKREHEVKLLTKGAIPLEETHAIAAKIRNEAGYTADTEITIFTEKRIYTDRYYQMFFGGTTKYATIPNVTTISLDFIRKLSTLSSSTKSFVFRAILVNVLSSIAQEEGLSVHDNSVGCILDFCNHMSDIMRVIDNGPEFCDVHMSQIMRNNNNYLLDLVKVISDTEDIAGQDIEVSKKILSPNKARLLEDESQFDYEVALSFAGEDRRYAEELARALQARNVKVFYDAFEKAKLWGEDLFVYLSDLYRLRAKYCVMFLSEHYARKLWTNHERKAAQSRAFKENKAYILPIRLDDTEIPGILETVGYLNWNEEGAEKIASYVMQKIKRFFVKNKKEEGDFFKA